MMLIIVESFEYVILFFFGILLQFFIGMVDIGSDLVWIQCLFCINCYIIYFYFEFDFMIFSFEVYVFCIDFVFCIVSNVRLIVV